MLLLTCLLLSEALWGLGFRVLGFMVGFGIGCFRTTCIAQPYRLVGSGHILAVYNPQRLYCRGLNSCLYYFFGGGSLLYLEYIGPPNSILAIKAPNIEPYYQSPIDPFTGPLKGTLV